MFLSKIYTFFKKFNFKNLRQTVFFIASFLCLKLCVDILDYFPELTYGVISDGAVNLFVHSSVHDRQKLYGPNNFGTLFYEVIGSPFILWNSYLDVLARIVLNYCDKLIVPALLSGIEIECRSFPLCNPLNCFVMKKEKIIDIVFSSGISLPNYYMLEVFSTYQLGKDYNNPYLSIDRDNKKK